MNLSVGSEDIDGLDPCLRALAGASTLHPAPSNPAQQNQDEEKGQHEAQSTTRVIAPIPAMRPGGQCAKQQQNQQDNQYSS